MGDLAVNVSLLRSRAPVILRSLSGLAPLSIRLTVGAVFIGSGWGKLHDLDKVTEFFAELGIFAPSLNALVVACTEFVGGLALFIGLGTRLAALPLATTMVVAIGTALLPDVPSPLELIASSEFAYLVMFVSLTLTGPGRFSVDALLVRRGFIRSSESARVAAVDAP